MARPPRPPRRTQGVLGGRSARVVQGVLEAAIDELARSGYHGFQMDEVATRAKVNKTTIYRRWPTREALVAAAVERMRVPLEQEPLPDTGSLEADLVQAFTRRFTVGRRSEGRAWARLLEERFRPEVEAMVGAAVGVRRDEWRAMVTRGVARGELPPRTDAQLVIQLVRALVDARRPGARPDLAWLTLAVRTVLAGARAGTLNRPVRPPAPSRS